MDASKILSGAHKMAASAKPGMMKIDDKLYTLVFNQRDWTYEVFEDGFLYTSFNTKSLKTAKKWLVEYINH